MHLLSIVEWSNKNAGFAQVALTSILVLTAIVSSYFAACAILQTRDELRAQFMPRIVFSVDCTNPNTPALEARNSGVGVAVDVEMDWQATDIGKAMPTAVSRRGPATMANGEIWRIPLTYNPVDMAIAQAFWDPRDLDRLVGTLRATYEDVLGNSYESKAHYQFEGDSRVVGSCETIQVQHLELPSAKRASWRRIFVG
jgi:hypothetical protein